MPAGRDRDDQAITWHDAGPDDRGATAGHRLRRDPRRTRHPRRLPARRGGPGAGVGRRASARVRAPGRAVRHPRSARLADLDQAVHLSRQGDGYLVRYAIADVAGFVDARPGHSPRRPGGAAPPCTARTGPRRCIRSSCPRVRRACCPGRRGRPSSGRSSWTRSANRGRVDVRRASVSPSPSSTIRPRRSTPTPGRLHPSIALLPEIGALRQAAGPRAAAISLDIPDTEIVRGPDGRWTLELRAVLAIEQYNAEISLLTGMCAAPIMLDGGVGLLRTLPPPTRISRSSCCGRPLRRWAFRGRRTMPVSEVIAGLDGDRPRDAAFLEDAVRLLRGAGYTAVRRRPARAGRARRGRRARTRTSPRRCGGWPTGTPPRCAWRCTPANPSRTGPAPRCRNCRDDERRPTARRRSWPRPARARCRCSCCTAGRARSSRRPCCSWIRTENRAVVILHEPPVRAHCPPDGLVEGSVITVRLRLRGPVDPPIRGGPGLIMTG